MRLWVSGPVFERGQHTMWYVRADSWAHCALVVCASLDLSWCRSTGHRGTRQHLRCIERSVADETYLVRRALFAIKMALLVMDEQVEVVQEVLVAN